MKMKKKTDAGELVERAQWERLTKEEISEVIERLQAFVIDIHHKCYGYSEKPKMLVTRLTLEEIELDQLIETLGYVGAFESIEPGYVELVEKFIVYPPFPVISATALQVLCIVWELTEHYLDKIKSYMGGESWDKNGDVKIMAMSIAGSYVKKTHDGDCLKLLLEIFDNKNEKKFDRQIAYRSIARGFGFEIINNEEKLDPDRYMEDPIVYAIINKARKHANKQDGK
jgi:hypothetical protein